MDKEKFPIALDVVAHPNRNVFFYPAGRNFDGEVHAHHVPGPTVPGAISKLKSIPGHRVYVDLDERVFLFAHRMTLPENKEKDRQLREIIAADPKYMHAKFDRYEEDDVYHVSPSEWNTWLWHLRCMVNHGRFRPVKGDKLIPTPDDIYALAEKTGDWPVFGDFGNLESRDRDRPLDRLSPHNASSYGVKVAEKRQQQSNSNQGNSNRS